MSAAGWTLEEKDFDPELIPGNETIFALSNGYIGCRGDLEEGENNFHAGTYLNGFYEMRPIQYGEWGYGFAKFHQTIQNTANPKLIKTRVNGTILGIDQENCPSHRRVLDLKQGILKRTMEQNLPSGDRIRYESRRFVSLADPHLIAIEIAVTPLDGEASVVFESFLDGSTANRIDFGDPRVSSHDERSKEIIEFLREGNAVALAERTKLSRITAASAVIHAADREALELVALPDDECPGTATAFRVAAGETVRFRKFAYLKLHTTEGEADLVRLLGDLRAVADRGFETLLAEHSEELDSFWRIGDVEIEGNDEVQRKLRYSLYQLYQAGRFLIDASIPAKGLTSEGYEGHFFWDTEIFIMPYFAFTRPEQARQILSHRYGMLDAARARAREMAERGALFPWRTINGQEASAYFLAGTAQYHINAAIAYGIRQYVAVSGDYQFLLDEGAEVLFETARAWISLGFFNESMDGLFCINGVTGPDEYTALVNNNCYTNMMARFHLSYASEVYFWMAEEHFEALQGLTGNLGLQPEEVDEWREAAEKMHIPYSRELGIHLQDDGFLNRTPWDFAGTPKERYPLLLNFHPLVIYRHRVLKQPDMLMAAFLLPEELTDGEHLRAYEYYTPLTTFDSSLGAPVQAIISARQGHLEEAWKFFTRNLNVDLDNIQGNVKDGLHMAATGGSWQAVVFGFAGLRMEGSMPWFEPHLPQEITSLGFRLRLQQSLLAVELGHREVRYELIEGTEIILRHEYEIIRLKPGESASRSLIPELKGLLLYLPELTESDAEELVPLLDTAASLGMRRILCASSEGHPLLSAVDLAASNEMVVRMPPDPEALFSGATLAELPTRDCLLITNNPEGVEAGKRAKIPTVSIDSIVEAKIPSAVEIQELFQRRAAAAEVP